MAVCFSYCKKRQVYTPWVGIPGRLVPWLLFVHIHLTLHRELLFSDDFPYPKFVFSFVNYISIYQFINFTESYSLYS